MSRPAAVVVGEPLSIGAAYLSSLGDEKRITIKGNAGLRVTW
jgi:hypothetical protein